MKYLKSFRLGLKIPMSIPRRRLLVTFFVLCITSTIFVVNTSLVTDLQNVDQDFFGVHDDVFIIFNDKATTPFTSKLPDTIVDSTARISGVITVSPEILQPATIADQAIYARGGILSDFEQIEKNTGRLTPVVNDTVFIGSVAVIGIDLANRLGVQIGDDVTINSILNNNLVTVKIISIISGYKVYSDEILIPLPLARNLSLSKQSEIGHLRVQYDRSIVSEAEIRRIATLEYELTIVLEYGNGTQTTTQIYLSLYNQENKILFTTEAENTQIYYLPQGQYTVRFHDFYNKTIDVVGNTQIQLNKNLVKTYITSKFVYRTIVEVSKEQYLVRNAEVSLNNSKFTYRGLTDENGKFTSNVAAGIYNLAVQTKNSLYTKRVFINGSIVININISSLPFNVNLLQITNGSIITTDSVDLFFAESADSFDLLLDSIPVGHINAGSLQTYIHLELSEGNHNFSLINTNIIGKIENYVEFVVDYLFDPISTINLMSGAQYSPNQMVLVDTRGFVNSTFSVQSNDEYLSIQSINSSYSQFQLPATEGFATITMLYNLFGESNLIFQWKIVIVSSNETVGWVATTEIPEFKLGDTLHIWMKNSTLAVVDSTWQLLPDSEKGMYEIRSTLNNQTQWLVTENLTVHIGGDLETLYFKPVVNYTLSIYAQSTLISPTNIINSSKIQIAYDEQEYMVSVIMNTLSFDIATNQSIYLSNQTSYTAVNITNRNSQNSEIIILQINVTTSYVPLLVDGYYSAFYTPRVNFESNQNTTTTLYFQNNNSIFQQFTTVAFQPTIKLLPAGEYYANISNDKYSSYFLWNFTIYAGSNILYLHLNATDRIYHDGFLLYAEIAGNYSLLKDNGLYYINGKPISVINDITEISLIGDVVSTSSYTNITLQQNVFAKYIIDYQNGTQTSNYYNGIIFITVPNTITNISLKVVGLDLLNRNFEISQQILLNQVLQPIKFEFINRSLAPVNNIYLQINEISLSKITNLYITNSTHIYTYDSLTNQFIFTVADASKNPILFQVTKVNATYYIFYIGSPELRLNATIPNTGITNKFSGYIQYSSVISSNSYKINFQNLEYLTLPVGVYNFTFIYSYWTATKILTLNFSTFYTIQFPVVKTSFTIVLDSSIRNTDLSVAVYHRILHIQQQGNLTNFSPLTYNFIDFPIGDVEIRIRSIKVNINHRQLISFSSDSYSISLSVLNGESSSEDVSKYLNKNLSSYDFGFASSNSYLNVFLGRTFLIINVILIAQVMLVFLVSFFNISILMRSVIQESLHEIKILKSIGASRTTTLLSIGREIFGSSLVAGVIGLLLAKIIIALFNKTNNLVIFGHKFVPELNNSLIIITNLLLIFALTVSSAYYAYHIELSEQELV